MIDRTCNYLERNRYFGMSCQQVFIMKQDVVPAISNMEGELAIQMDGHLVKKPHGHGDVHFCLYRVSF